MEKITETIENRDGELVGFRLSDGSCVSVSDPRAHAAIGDGYVKYIKDRQAGGSNLKKMNL